MKSKRSGNLIFQTSFINMLMNIVYVVNIILTYSNKHLISFNDDGSILISDKISKTDLDILGISSSIKLKVDTGMKKYLLHHRIKFNKEGI